MWFKNQSQPTNQKIQFFKKYGVLTSSKKGNPVAEISKGITSTELPYLNALLDPEVVPHGLPVLGAGHIQQPFVDPALHGIVKNLEELGPDEWLGTAQARQEGGLEFSCQFTARQSLIPVIRNTKQREQLLWEPTAPHNTAAPRGTSAKGSFVTPIQLRDCSCMIHLLGL